jgi:hypothetical protein
MEIEYSINSASAHQLKLKEKAEDEKPKPETDKLRQLQTPGYAYCINSPNMLNLFNTLALAEQSSFY